jgi:two-component sensor histidine kinase
MVVWRRLKGRNKRLTEELAARHRAELELQAGVRDKVALLKEVHHRVRNNRQIICSLLRLEAGRCVSLENKVALEDSFDADFFCESSVLPIEN